MSSVRTKQVCPALSETSASAIIASYHVFLTFSLIYLLAIIPPASALLSVFYAFFAQTHSPETVTASIGVNDAAVVSTASGGESEGSEEEE
ncbi:unnamed protein product [Somion occarium]|uniref:Uncharacterized protein n=1 Tax=Somion occarium TaxID=3059160 RepID=A0ABP1DC61_9APHY